MDALIMYFGKMILCSAILFAYYHLSLKDKTFHHYNRFYLLTVVIVSVLLPLLKISYFTLEISSDSYLLLNKLQNFNSTKTLVNDPAYYRIGYLSVGLVSVLILARFVLGILKIKIFKKQFPKEEIDGISFYQTNLENAPFSFFRNLFWKNSILLNSDLGRQILKHEMVHIQQKHTHDKIFMEVATGIFWFNPVFWFIKKEINLIHEYLADKKAVKHMDTRAFAQMLLASHFSGTVIPATSPFLSSNLKKRVKMLQKPKTKFGYAHRILALPIVFTLAFVYAVNAKNKEIKSSNAEIAAVVAAIGRDTIKPKTVEEKIRIQSDSARFYSDQLRKEDEKIKNLNKQIADKSKIVQSLAKSKADSPEYLKAENELAALMNKQGIIWNSLQYQEKWKNTEQHFEKMDALFNSPEYRKKWKEMELKSKEMEQMFNSEEFKNKIRQAEKIAEKAAATAKNAAKESAGAALEMEKAKLAVEKAELNRKQFELNRKEAELKAKEAKEKGTLRGDVIVVQGVKPQNVRSYTVTSAFSEGSKETVGTVLGVMEKSDKEKKYGILDPDMKVYLDGKEIPYNELKKLSPKFIKSVHVNKNDRDGRKDYKMYVVTK